MEYIYFPNASLRILHTCLALRPFITDIKSVLQSYSHYTYTVQSEICCVKYSLYEKYFK